MTPTEIALVVLIVFAATLARSTFGFGEALLSMPLLSFVVGVKTAAPLVAIVALFTSPWPPLRLWKPLTSGGNRRPKSLKGRT